MTRSAREEVSACASVLATTKSTPISPETIMLLTALPPAPPMPHTIMRGFNSRSSGALRLIDIVWPLDVGAPLGVALLCDYAWKKRISRRASSFFHTTKSFLSTIGRRGPYSRAFLLPLPPSAAADVNIRFSPLADKRAGRPLRRSLDSWPPPAAHGYRAGARRGSARQGSVWRPPAGR